MMSPRGNDAQQALADLRGEYGATANADELRQAARFAYSPQLRQAQLLPYRQEDSESLELDKVNAKVDDGEVVAASVRGDDAVQYVVAVVEHESGRTSKAVFPYGDFGGPKPRGRAAVVKDLSEGEQAERANVEQVLRKRAAVAQAEREAEEEVRKARAKAAEKVQEASDEADAQTEREVKQTQKSEK